MENECRCTSNWRSRRTAFFTNTYDAACSPRPECQNNIFVFKVYKARFSYWVVGFSYFYTWMLYIPKNTQSHVVILILDRSRPVSLGFFLYGTLSVILMLSHLLEVYSATSTGREFFIKTDTYSYAFYLSER